MLTDLAADWLAAAGGGTTGGEIEVYPTHPCPTSMPARRSPSPRAWAASPWAALHRGPAGDRAQRSGELGAPGVSRAPWNRPPASPPSGRGRRLRRSATACYLGAMIPRRCARRQSRWPSPTAWSPTYTSLVAVDEAVARPPGAPTGPAAKCPASCPEGWDYDKVFGEGSRGRRTTHEAARGSGLLHEHAEGQRRRSGPQSDRPAADRNASGPAGAHRPGSRVRWGPICCSSPAACGVPGRPLRG